MALMVKCGLLISSIRYSTRSDGSAIVIKTIAGKMVQIISTS